MKQTADEIKEKVKPVTLREVLENLERQGQGHDERLDAVKIPEGFEYLWTMFWEVYGGGSEGMSGVRITWRDLQAYQEVTGVFLDSFESEALMAMDRALHEAIAEG